MRRYNVAPAIEPDAGRGHDPAAGRADQPPLRRPALRAVRHPRPAPRRRRLRRRRAARRRRPRQAPADPLRRRSDAVRPPSPGRVVRRRTGGRRPDVEAAHRAVDGGRPADRRRRSDPRRGGDGQGGDDRRPSRARPLRTRAARSRSSSSRGCRRSPMQPLGGALLDQRNVAGFGNVYAVELPFIVGVSPHQPIGTVDGLLGLLGLGAAVIRTNAERGPQNTTGRRLHAADHWIYARRGRPCPLCGTTLDGCGRPRQPVAAGHRVVPAVPARRAAPHRRPRPRPPPPRPPPRPPPGDLPPADSERAVCSATLVASSTRSRLRS